MKNRDKYENMTNEQIIKYWNDNAKHASELGSLMHSTIETYLTNILNNIHHKLVITPEALAGKPYLTSAEAGEVSARQRAGVLSPMIRNIPEPIPKIPCPFPKYL